MPRDQRGQRSRLLGEAVLVFVQAPIFPALPPLEVVLDEQARGVRVGRGVGRPLAQEFLGRDRPPLAPARPLFGQDRALLAPEPGEASGLVQAVLRLGPDFSRAGVPGWRSVPRGNSLVRIADQTGHRSEMTRGDALSVVIIEVRSPDEITRVDALRIVGRLAVRRHE